MFLQPEDHLHATDVACRDTGSKRGPVLPGDSFESLTLELQQQHFSFLSSPTHTGKYEATSVETQSYCLI